MKTIILLLAITVILSLTSCERPNHTTFQDVESGQIISVYDEYDLAIFDTLIIQTVRTNAAYSDRPQASIWGIYHNGNRPRDTFDNGYYLNRRDTVYYVRTVEYILVTEVRKPTKP